MSLRLQNPAIRLFLLLLAMGIQTALFGADLQRPYDPVVIQGSQMADFLGADTSDIFVYAYKDGGWQQIPFQIDQIDSVTAEQGYSYFAPHNGMIDARDELCFMAGDMGDSVADNRWIGDISSTLYQRYQVAAWDTSVAPARKAYAYVYRSGTITPAFSLYMDYQAGAVGRSDTVRAVSYTYGQSGDAIPDYLSLKSGETSGPDILDRWKIRFKGSIGPGFGLPSYIESEESALRDTSVQVRVGPVRVIHEREYELIWQGIDIGISLSLESIFYPWSYKIDLIKESLPGYLGMTEMRQTVDYLPNISGSLFHWSKGTDIPVDGVLDAFADKTFEVPGVNWYMVQGDFGTAATVFDLDPIEGTQLSLYYIDDASKTHGATRDGIGDTGDSMAYAESGVQLAALTQSIDITDENLSATFYYLPEYHTAAFGDSLAGYTEHPLKVVVMPRTNTVIPVEMGALKAQTVKEAVRLDWTTVSESNNYGFDIERRSAAEGWKKIGFVKGHGTTQTAHAYFFLDEKPETGTLYYRLKQIDLDGRVSFSQEVAIDIQLPQTLALEQNYPNPFNPGTDISFQLPASTQQRVSLVVYNLLGQKIITLVDKQLDAGTHHIFWDGRDERGLNVVSGAYLYRLQMGEQILTRKMIKMQ
jgi:hypothetical protein